MDPMTGEPRVLNDITQARFDLAIEEAPWTPTQRDRAMEMLTAMSETEQDPIMRNALHQAAIMVGDIPFKSKVMDLVQQAKGEAQQATAAQAGAQRPPGGGGQMPPEVLGDLGLSQGLNPSEQALQVSPEQMAAMLNPVNLGQNILPNQEGMMV